MDSDFFESQIDKRRKQDEEVYQDAFSDLMEVLNIKSPKTRLETQGAVADILKYLGEEVPNIPSSVTELNEQMEYMLRPSGMMKRRVELLGKWWKDGDGCFLGSTKDGTIVPILPGKWGGYEYKDKNGNMIKVNKRTSADLNIDAFCFYKAFPLKKLKISDLVKFMIKSVQKSDAVIILCVFAFLQFLTMFTTPYITKIIYGILIPSNSVSLIGPVAFFLIGVGLGVNFISIIKGMFVSTFLRKLNVRVNSAVMIRLFSLPTKFFKNYSSGELASRMGYISSLCQIIAEDMLPTLLTAIFSFGYIFQMYQFAPQLVLPGMIVVVISILSSALFTFMQQKINKKQMELSPKLQSLVYAIYSGIQKIKITGSEKRAFAKWAKQYSEVQKLHYSPPTILKIQSVISLVITTFGSMAIYYFAGSCGIPIDDYYAFNIAYGMITSAIVSLSGIVLQVANLKPVIDMIKPVMNEEPESSSGRKIVTSLSGMIEINNLSFKYEENGPMILEDISLKIKKGEYVGIVGKTGCGKSTLIRLLLGFEKPLSGAIYYDGKDLNDLDIKSVRRKIGVVLQNGSLFPGDVFSNIIITSPWKTLDDAWEAAALAGIDKDIDAMPMGMHTLISEGAGGISGGQKQRLMIARALIAKPSLLFFDEATSALDNITQKHVSDSISSLNCTRLVIAHRLSTIKNCDRIIVLSKGRIVEQGPYDDLMAKQGEFYSLAKRQIAD